MFPRCRRRKATGKVLTMRERLSEHRKNPACASCHARMDPLGFALENFDATGKWRTVESTGPADKTRNPIDASGQLADGTKFEGAKGLRAVLLEHSGEFVYRMTERLLTYALGRGSEWYDAPAIRAAVNEAKKDDYRFSSLLMGIVQSAPFQMRLSQSIDSAGAIPAGAPHAAVAGTRQEQDRKGKLDDVSTKDFAPSAFVLAWPWRDARPAVTGRDDAGLRRHHQGDTETWFHVHPERRQPGPVEPHAVPGRTSHSRRH